MYKHRLKQVLDFISHYPFIFFVLIAAIAYWPVTFLFGSLHHDVINVTLPWRVFTSECFQNGIFPYWNPYQQMGYPIHADLQYPIWYPEFLLISLFTVYSNIILHFLFIIYTALAGLGMFKLARSLSISHPYAMLAGVCFLLSGLFIGQAQSYTSILAAVWLPWVLAYYIRMISNRFAWSRLLKFTVFMFIMLTGGYQAISFMLVYVMGILFVYRVITILAKKNYKEFWELIKAHAIVTLLLVPLCFGMLYALYQVFPYLPRLSGLPIESAQQFMFTPQSMISMLVPFATIRNLEFFATDVSYTNNFVAALVLVSAAIGLFQKRKPGFLIIITIIGFMFLLASFGSYTPVHKWFYDYLPFMRLFKYPTFFRYFFVLAVILLGSYALSLIDSDRSGVFRNWFFTSVIGLFVVYLGIIVYSAQRINVSELIYLNPDLSFFRKLKEATMYDNAFVQACLQFAVLFSFLVFYIFRWLPFRKLIMICAILELIIAAQLNMFVTVCGPTKPMELKKELALYPHAYPIPDDVPIAHNADEFMRWNILWLNMGNYTKQPSPDAFTSFWFQDWEYLADSVPALLDSITTNRILYFSDDIRPFSELEYSNYSSKTVFVNDTNIANLPVTSASDSLSDKIAILNFNPNHIQCEVHSSKDQALILLQNDYTGWQVFVDNIPVQHYTVNSTFIGIPLARGKHRIEFRYALSWVQIGYWVSMVVFVILVFIILFMWKQGFAYRLSLALIIGLFFMFAILLHINRLNKNEREHSLEDDLYRKVSYLAGNRLNKNVGCILSADNLLKFQYDSVTSPYFLINQTIRKTDAIALISSIQKKAFDTLHYVRINTLENEVLKAYLKHNYNSESVVSVSRNTDYRVLYNQGQVDGGAYAQKYPVLSMLTPGTDSLFFNSSMQSLALLKLKGNEVREGSTRINFYADFFWNDIRNAAIILEIVHKGQRRVYKGFELASDASLGKWDYEFYSFQIPVNMGRRDQVNLYIWSPNGAEFSLKGAEAEIVAYN